MVIKEYRHFDQVKRVEKSPKAKQGYPCKIPTPTVIQSVAKNLLERHRCSYHKLGDLSTSLEMTIPFLVVIQRAYNARRISGDGFIPWKGHPSL